MTFDNHNLQNNVHPYHTSLLDIEGLLLKNHCVQGLRFEELKEDIIVEVCLPKKSWTLVLTSIKMVDFLLTMLEVFQRICFFQNQGFASFYSL